jgi:hypothetical protein
MANNNQRIGSLSNSQVGSDFELEALTFFSELGIMLKPVYPVNIGIGSVKKSHKFDMGNAHLIVECKAHTWTETDNMPSAKMATWNQAMFYFHASPHGHRKILFVQRDFSRKRNETLAQYYVRTNPHLIPDDVEIWEYEPDTVRGIGKGKVTIVRCLMHQGSWSFGAQCVLCLSQPLP